MRSDPLGLCPIRLAGTTICQRRDWHNLKVAEKIAALQAAGFLVAPNVAIRLVSASSTTYAVADYIATIPDSGVYVIGEVKTGNAGLSENQLQNYGTGFAQVIGQNGLPVGLEPDEVIPVVWAGIDRFPGCPVGSQ
jgi:hypothetical protein